MEIFALQDTGSTVILIDKILKESLKIDAEDCRR